MEGHDKMADWWSFGILLFEMLCGIPPFYVENLDKMYDMIQNSSVKFPKRVNLSNEAKDVIQKLLEKNPKKRLGSQKGIEEIKSHPFFLAYINLLGLSYFPKYIISPDRSVKTYFFYKRKIVF